MLAWGYSLYFPFIQTVTIEGLEEAERAIDQAIRIDKDSGNVSKSFNNSYFEYFLEENIDDLLRSKSNNSELKEILN